MTEEEKAIRLKELEAQSEAEEISNRLGRLQANSQIINAHAEARKQAEQELDKIINSGKVTATDYISDTRGVDYKNPTSVIASSLFQNGPVNTLKKIYNANDKETRTLINNYEQIISKEPETQEEYFKNKVLAELIEDKLKGKNSGLLSKKENMEKSTLLGIQNFVTNSTNSLLAQTADRMYSTDLERLLGIQNKETEEQKKELFNLGRKYLTSEGEQRIDYQQKYNAIVSSGLEKLAYDAGFTIGDMTIPILVGIATGNAAGATGATAAEASKFSQAASLATMFNEVYGSAYTEAIDSGASTYRAKIYADAVAGTEVLTEILGGETILSAMAGRPAESLIGKVVSNNVISKVKGNLAKGIIAFATDLGGESVEEFLAGIADPVWKKAILGGEDIDAADLFADAYSDAIGAILPSLILNGLGKPAMLNQINTLEENTLAKINQATWLTNTQKSDMIKRIKEVSANARIGVNDKYNETYDAVWGEIENQFGKNLNIYQNAETVQRLTGVSDADTLRLAESQGFVYNPTRMTTQEILDTTTKQETNYSEAITKDIESLLESDKSLTSITPVTETNKAKQNIANAVSGLADGQVVFANIETNNGTKVYGLTNGTNIYINAELNDKDTLAAAFHELGHIYAKKNPQEFKAYKNAFYKENKNAEQILKDYNNIIGKYEISENLTEEQKDYLLEELFGDYVGQTMSQTKNTKTLEDSKKNMFDKLKQYGDELKSKYLGTERNNTDVSEYNLDEASYLDTELVSDENLENQVVGMFTDKPEETTKSIFKLASINSPREAQGNDVYDRIEQRYKDMKEKESQVAIKKMIANELGKEYNALNEDREVKRIYADLKDNGEITRTGVKFSGRSKNNAERTKRKVSNESLYESETTIFKRLDEQIGRYLRDTAEMKKSVEITTKVNNLQKQVINDFEKKYNVKVSYFVEKGQDFLGFASDDGIYLSAGIANEAKLRLVAGHELVEYVLLKRNKTANKAISNIIEDLLENEEGMYQYKIFKLKEFPVDLADFYEANMYLLAKELLCDINGLENLSQSSEYRRIIETNFGEKEVAKIYRELQQLIQSVVKDAPVKLSSRKESNTERIVNNQRDEIERLSAKNEELSKENKGLKKIVKGIKSTGRQQIKNVQSESNKMLKTGREQELKMRGQLERAGKKYNKLSEAAIDIKYENQLAEKARVDGINFPREYKDLFIGLRRAGDSIKEAYATTKSIFDESQVVNRSIDNSISILREIRKRKLYNKLPNDIKAKINEYDKIWAGSRQQSNLTLAKRILASLKAREMLGNIAMTQGVRNQIMSMEGYGWENGKGSVSLKELFNESKELAVKFEQGLIALREEIKNFERVDKNEERVMQIKDTIDSSQKAVSIEEKKQDKLKIKRLTKKVTNKTLFNSLMTLKTEIQALMGGNINTPLMVINNNLQNGELRKKQAIVEMYRILSDFMKKSSGINRALNTQRWSKSLEKSLSNSSEWIDTGYKVKAERGGTSTIIELKLPRSMAMSLAMHLLNDDNMLHISGGAVQITVDDNGNVDVKRGEGKGVQIPDEELFRRGKEKEAYDRGATVKLTHEQVEKIASMLTEEEKAFVKATQEVFKYTTELINEVSNRVFGYDLATVENYFPIRVWDKGESKGAVINAPMQKMYGDALSHMLNPGWLQQRVTSFNPIYLENIAEVLNRTMNNVANFYGYAEALRDNHLILDSTMADGTEFSKHIDYLSSDFMSDYNRLTRFITGQEALRDGKFRGLMAMNTLTFNVGTWLTQPMSFFNTLKYFNSKEFLSGINPINNNIKLNKMIRNYFKELGIDDTKYDDYQVARAFIAMATPNLDYRALGYKIPELNQLFNKTMQQKIGAHGIEAFDNIAVTAIARMMAYAVSLDKSIKFGSERYFEVLGDRLTKALVETQPEYSQVNRANMFRSANPVLRTLSLFGTPANQMFNNFAQSMMELRYELREGNKEGIKAARVDLAKSISGIILSSVMVGLIRALRDKARDDDDKVDFRDRWIAQSTIAALGPTLVLDDLAQLIMSTNNFGGVSSYDFNTPETTFLNGFSNLYNKSLQLFKEDVSPAKKTTDLIKAIGVITPIDTKDVIRVTTMLMKTMAPDMYSAYKLQQDSTVYKKWLENQETDMATFYKAYTNTRTKVLEEKYGYHKEDKAKGIKSNLKEAREKALKDVLKNQSEVDKYMEILFNYKKTEG